MLYALCPAKLDQIQLMANDSCKMAWINLIYLRKNWQSEGQRINKSWQWLLQLEFFPTHSACSLSICRSLRFGGDFWFNFFSSRDNSISFNLVVVASVRRSWWHIVWPDIGGLCRFSWINSIFANHPNCLRSRIFFVRQQTFLEIKNSNRNYYSPLLFRWWFDMGLFRNELIEK